MNFTQVGIRMFKKGDLVKYNAFARTGKPGFKTVGIIVTEVKELWDFKILSQDGEIDIRTHKEVRSYGSKKR